MTGPRTGLSDPHAALARLLGPGRPELSCDACFERLDEYVELEHGGAAANALIPGMAAHLEGCAACREEHDSLLALIASEPHTLRAP